MSHTIKPVSRTGSGLRAKYLILVDNGGAQRALLFNGEHRFLSEVIGDDDGEVLETLMRSSRQCPTPGKISFDAVVPPPAVEPSEMRCFALG